MEKQLFDWNGWDQSDTATFLYYNIILKVKIGSYDIGTKFESACIDYENGTLAFYNTDELPVALFRLKLEVVVD